MLVPFTQNTCTHVCAHTCTHTCMHIPKPLTWASEPHTIWTLLASLISDPSRLPSMHLAWATLAFSALEHHAVSWLRIFPLSIPSLWNVLPPYPDMTGSFWFFSVEMEELSRDHLDLHGPFEVAANQPWPSFSSSTILVPVRESKGNASPRSVCS